MIKERAHAAPVSTRDQLLAAIAELSVLSPDWRIGQLVCNVADFAGDDEQPPTAWDATDEQLLAAARELIRQRRANGGRS